ncbi:MAG: DNA topoisomerase-3 [Candidatus Omnitrophota bacterium]|jgi:DNA topoisomerase-3
MYRPRIRNDTANRTPFVKVILAEKPSVARDIAKELKATSRHEGYLSGNGYAVTWAFGHLVGLKAPDDYDPAFKRWNLDDLPIIPAKFELKPTGDEGARKQLNIIKKLFKEADELICATDAGREGELIFRYIQMWARVTNKPFKRLWISSLTSQAIRDGFNKLADGHAYDNLAAAARCRSEADWIVGMNGSRYFTVHYGGKQTLWSIGRVQTPVLALIVNRDHEIEHFDPKDYWELHTIYREARFKHTTGRWSEVEKAQAILEKVTGHDLVITDVQQKAEKTPPLLLHDLTDLQKEMNRRWGMTADQVLKIAQTLYERKHLTYPRTDSQYLSKDMKPQIPDLLEKLKAIKGAEIAPLDLAKLPFTSRIINDAKVTDHHAIIPTEVVGDRLSGDEAKVYDAVVTRFIAAFYPPCIKQVTTVLAESNAEPFKATGRVTSQQGWQALYPHMGKKKKKATDDKEDDADQEMPAFVKDEHGPHEPEMIAKKTKPPKRYTEASLLQAMETAGRMVDEEELKDALKDKGIGTPATRASIIETLISRTYIKREKKNLLSTDDGRHLIGLVADDRLKSPELTGEWEANLKKMEKGQYAPKQFMDEVIEHTRIIIGGGDGPNTGLGPCPRCEAPVIKGRVHFGCSRWKEGCTFVLRNDSLGTEVSAGLASELLRNRETLKSQLLKIDGETVFGKMKLEDDGTVTYEAVSAKSAGKGKDVLGTCPACGGDIIESVKGYGCSNWQNGCRFVIWKTIAGKKVSKTMVGKLLKDGETEVLKGFKSRAGKSFDAKLKVKDNDVKFEF